MRKGDYECRSLFEVRANELSDTSCNSVMNNRGDEQSVHFLMYFLRKYVGYFCGYVFGIYRLTNNGREGGLAVPLAPPKLTVKIGGEFKFYSGNN